MISSAQSIRICQSLILDTFGRSMIDGKQQLVIFLVIPRCLVTSVEWNLELTLKFTTPTDAFYVLITKSDLLW